MLLQESELHQAGMSIHRCYSCGSTNPGIPVILIPADCTPNCLLIPIRTEVSPSATTEFSIGPASYPTIPAARTRSSTLTRAALLPPQTSTSQPTSTPNSSF